MTTTITHAWNVLSQDQCGDAVRDRIIMAMQYKKIASSATQDERVALAEVVHMVLVRLMNEQLPADITFTRTACTISLPDTLDVSEMEERMSDAEFHVGMELDDLIDDGGVFQELGLMGD